MRSLRIAAASLTLAATLAPTAASARHWDDGYAAPYAARGYGRIDNRQQYRNGRGGYYRQGYRCDRGTGGTILGAIAGGLLGNAAVGHHGDRTAGTIAGAGVGALLGRSVDRNC